MVEVYIVQSYGSPFLDRIACIVQIKRGGSGYNVYMDQLETKWYRPGCYFIDESLLNDDTLAYEGWDEE